MPILAFHSIDKQFSLGLNNYNPKRFRNLLIALNAAGFNFISLSDYIASSDKGNSVVITFDDGYDSIYINAAPILGELKIPAVIFIPGDYIGERADWDYLSSIRSGRHMDEKQIKELSSGNFEIGSHGLTHIDLSHKSTRVIKVELEYSKRKLEDLTGKAVKYISWPFGRFNDETENIAAETGYERGFSLSFFRKSRYQFTYPRYAVYTTDTLLAVNAKLKSGGLNRLEQIKGSIMNSYAFGTVIWSRIRSHIQP